MNRPMAEASDFRQELAAIAQPADRAVREDHERATCSAAWPRAIPLIVVLPAVYLIVCLVLNTKGIHFQLPWWMVAAMSLLAPAIYFVNVSLPEPIEVSEMSALARIDDSLHLQDRMTSAREFLEHTEPTPFMRAAIEDARAHTEKARAFSSTGRRPSGKLTPIHAVWPLAALLIIVVSLWIEAEVSSSHTVSTTGGSRQDTIEVAASATTPSATKPSKTDARQKRRPEAPRDPSAVADKRGDDGVTAKNRKKSRGDQGKGKSSSAESSSGRSTGEGQATDQAQPTKGAKKKKPRKPESDQSPKKDPRRKNQRRPHDDDKSMASSGQGKGRGSSRSPTASEWSSKDQSVADDEEELEDEDEVDDEDEESEARGGLQPSLRQRKPPVNRDLSIGFAGGKPPPHANGRGGPGLPKKQRGVAQLVLGIPYPDQIAGQPNPGRTKVTQERIEPQPQSAEPVAAAARRTRSSRMGHLSKPVLLPWMQELVRAFQLSIQPKESQEPSRGERVR